MSHVLPEAVGDFIRAHGYKFQVPNDAWKECNDSTAAEYRGTFIPGDIADLLASNIPPDTTDFGPGESFNVRIFLFNNSSIGNGMRPSVKVEISRPCGPRGESSGFCGDLRLAFEEAAMQTIYSTEKRANYAGMRLR